MREEVKGIFYRRERRKRSWEDLALTAGEEEGLAAKMHRMRK
jgi:hypothetical protein